jgi:hypothetical protein
MAGGIEESISPNAEENYAFGGGGSKSGNSLGGSSAFTRTMRSLYAT